MIIINHLVKKEFLHEYYLFSSISKIKKILIKNASNVLTEPRLGDDKQKL
jgi:hypothetical protein